MIIGFGIFVYDLERMVNSFSDKVAKLTANFIKTKIGQMFLSLPLLGPIMFFPVQYDAWTTADVSSYQSITYPIIAVINISVYVSHCHHGEWRTRLSMIGWVLTMVSISIAGWIRG